MATRSKGENKQTLSPPMVIGAIVILMALLGWLFFKNFGPAPLPPEKPSTNAVRMGKIFSDSGGDWNKVSDADKQWIHQFSQGKEAMAWAYMKGGQAHH